MMKVNNTVAKSNNVVVKGNIADMKRIHHLAEAVGLDSKDLEPLDFSGFTPGEKKRVNIIALGDVGANLLLALKLLGGSQISSIGIFDRNDNLSKRFEMEMNQIDLPFGGTVLGLGGLDSPAHDFPLSLGSFPPVEIIDEAQLFNCHVLVFCASKGVPPLGSQVKDVRMGQLEVNRPIAEHYGALGAAAGFKGLFAVVSDPVDPLCKAVYLGSLAKGNGLKPAQIHGYGLGVMNARARYFAKQNPEMAEFLSSGRSFGPHGGDLIIANSIENYNHNISMELTKLTIEANLKVRDLGYKPYLAPSVSSGALSLLLTMSGNWHYSSVYIGKGEKGGFMGLNNRLGEGGFIYEDLDLPQALFQRIEKAYTNLVELI